VLRGTMLFASPPEDDIDWADVSPGGMHKWLSRVWRLTVEQITREETGLAEPGSEDAVADLRKAIAGAIVGVSGGYEARKYNTVIAKLMTLTNAVLDATRTSGAHGPAVREALEILLTMLAPICPFITEELWRRMGHDGSVHDQPWPTADTDLLIEAEVTIIVQVNGKVRGRTTVATDADQEAVEHAARESVDEHLDGEPKKVVFVPGKLVNFVV